MLQERVRGAPKDNLATAIEYAHRANDLLKEYSSDKSHTFTPWSVVGHCKRRIHEIGEARLRPMPDPDSMVAWSTIVIPVEPLVELDAYWNRVVLSSIAIPARTRTGNVIVDGIGTDNGILDNILLSAALQKNIPHSNLCNQSVGWYMAQKIIKGNEIDSVVDLIQLIEPIISYWNTLSLEDRTRILLATALLKNDLIQKDHAWLVKFTDKLSDFIMRGENSGWTFLVHRTIMEALMTIATNPEGRIILKNAHTELDTDFTGRTSKNAIWPLDYFLEQATMQRISAHKNDVKNAIAFADSEKTT